MLFVIIMMCLVWWDGVPAGGQGQIGGEGPGPHQPAHLPQGQVSQARGTVKTKRDMFPGSIEEG